MTETLSTPRRERALRESQVKRVHVDTTEQEKAVAFPMDTRLYHKARRALVRQAWAADICLHQRHVGLGQPWQGRYAQARQMKLALRETNRLLLYLGYVIFDILHKCLLPTAALKLLLEGNEYTFRQQHHDSPKLYSMHAPEVACMRLAARHTSRTSSAAS